MSLSVTTALQDVGSNSGEYPEALRDAASLLVEERSNFVPMYMPPNKMNALEEAFNQAEREGRVIEAAKAATRASREIAAIRGEIRAMLKKMADDWGVEYAYAALLSGDSESENPAILKPKDTQFSFEFRPKTFDLGLTGRLLEDGDGVRYQENLALACDIYDAYGLAYMLQPKRIVVVDSSGRQTVIYEDDKIIGNREAREFPRGKINYVLREQDSEKTHDDWQLLPTNGLSVVLSDFGRKIKKYERKAMLFGHAASSMEEFLNRALASNHLMWRSCANFTSQYAGHDAPLIDCERIYGLQNQVARFPYHKDRLQLIPDRADINIGRISIHFDTVTAIQSLINLGDVVRDIWFDPADRFCKDGWDIVLDRARGIDPDHTVRVTGAADTERFSVLRPKILPVH